MTDRELLEHFEKTLADHILVPLIDDPGPVQCFELRKDPKRQLYLVELTFTPQGISIQGDTHPCRRGAISDLGYGLKWFVGDLHGDYLASKFLETGWVPEIAEQQLKELIEELKEHYPDDAEQLAEAAENAVFHTELNYHMALSNLDLVHDLEDLWPSYGYNPNDQAILWAIQRTFRRLFWETYKSLDKVEDGVQLVRR